MVDYQKIWDRIEDTLHTDFSPPYFWEFDSPDDYREITDRVREETFKFLGRPTPEIPIVDLGTSYIHMPRITSTVLFRQRSPSSIYPEVIGLGGIAIPKDWHDTESSKLYPNDRGGGLIVHPVTYRLYEYGLMGAHPFFLIGLCHGDPQKRLLYSFFSRIIINELSGHQALDQAETTLRHTLSQSIRSSSLTERPYEIFLRMIDEIGKASNLNRTARRDSLKYESDLINSFSTDIRNSTILRKASNGEWGEVNFKS